MTECGTSNCDTCFDTQCPAADSEPSVPSESAKGRFSAAPATGIEDVIDAAEGAGLAASIAELETVRTANATTTFVPIASLTAPLTLAGARPTDTARVTVDTWGPSASKAVFQTYHAEAPGLAQLGCTFPRPMDGASFVSVFLVDRLREDGTLGNDEPFGFHVDWTGHTGEPAVYTCQASATSLVNVRAQGGRVRAASQHPTGLPTSVQVSVLHTSGFVVLSLPEHLSAELEGGGSSNMALLGLLGLLAVPVLLSICFCRMVAGRKAAMAESRWLEVTDTYTLDCALKDGPAPSPAAPCDDEVDRHADSEDDIRVLVDQE
uniref:Uncharacterized protein n=1 Tax=Eutreptiella gymnastica TaxID=73025 RepID=A0A7S1JEM1_9EUGL